MTAIIKLLKSLLFPFRLDIKEIEDKIHTNRNKICENTVKIQEMVATLNGEDAWFLERKPGRRDQE